MDNLITDRGHAGEESGGEIAGQGLGIVLHLRWCARTDHSGVDAGLLQYPAQRQMP